MNGRQSDGDRAGVPDTPPVRHSSRFSNELVEDARQLFEEEMGTTLTAEDARQILENLTGFFMVLHEWDRKLSKIEMEGSPNNPNSPD